MERASRAAVRARCIHPRVAADRHGHAVGPRPAFQVPVDRVHGQRRGSRCVAWQCNTSTTSGAISSTGTAVPKGTYPHTASGALDHENKWQQILTSKPGGLNWMAAFSKATGKPVIIPEWGLDFHAFGGQDDPQFITNMMAWMKAHDAIGLYWGGKPRQPGPGRERPPAGRPGRRSQNNTPGAVNGMGRLMGGRLQYAGVYLPDSEWPSDSVAQPVLAPGSMRATGDPERAARPELLRPSSPIQDRPNRETGLPAGRLPGCGGGAQAGRVTRAAAPPPSGMMPGCAPRRQRASVAAIVATPMNTTPSSTPHVTSTTSRASERWSSVVADRQAMRG